MLFDKQHRKKFKIATVIIVVLMIVSMVLLYAPLG